MPQSTVITAQLPIKKQYSTGWVTQKIQLGEEIDALAYHEESQCFVLGVSQMVDFILPEDDGPGHGNHEGNF